MKKLLILVPNLRLGGQERVAINTTEIMAKFYDIIFVIFDSRDAVYKPHCEFIDLAIPSAPGMMAKLINVFRRAYELRKLKRDRNIDISLSFGSTANLANVLSGRRGKTFISLHGFDSVSAGHINRFVYTKSDAIVCCSQGICNALAQIDSVYGKKACCIHNPYDILKLREQAEETVTDYNFSLNTIVTHGRLEEVKNYPRLIKAFSLVQGKVPNSQLLIIGEGSLRPKLEVLIKAYHLENSVTLLGFRKNPFSYLANSALYVLSSYSEGFPNALVEGMTFLPTVAVDCKTGPREILSDGPADCVSIGWEDAKYGVLVQPAEIRKFYETLTEDDHILADAILSILKNPAKAKNMKEKAQSRVEDFSYTAYREALINLFEH